MHSSHTNHSAIHSSIHPPSTLSFRLDILEDSAPYSLSLSLSLTHSLYPPSAMQNTLFSVAAATACHFALPTYGKNQRGAVTKSTQLQTRDEDHATLCDPLAVAAGDAVCASLAFSITVPPGPARTHYTYNPFRRPIKWRPSLTVNLSSYEKQKKF